MLFDRIVELTVGDTDIIGLDIGFEIEKDLTPEPNPCHIEIFNLSAKNRAVLSQYKHVPVILKAGYRDQVGIIFQGDMIGCSHIKEGPTWKTVLANGDGAKAIQTARIKKTFSKGTLIKTVIKEIVEQIKIPSGNALTSIERLTDKLARGYTASGNPMDELCRILGQHGFVVSTQNNALQVQKHGQPLDKQAISLTTKSGLKGSPELGSDKTLRIQSVLMPELLPGQKIHVESAVFNGDATIQSVRFDGTNFDDVWNAELECKVG